MAGVAQRREQQTEDWYTLPWKEYQRNVGRLQQRIYQAASCDDHKRVHNLQRLLLRSWSARCLAVRRVTQDNRGKRTAGVDGVAQLDPPFRLALAKNLKRLSNWTADPLRRVYYPKPNGGQRKLGIPTMRDRAAQALVKLALEPEWEARFEPNSYGFRPGRAPHDAIEAVFNFTRLQPKYVLDADLEKCFDKISHEALLEKLHSIQPIMRLVQKWLKAGVLAGEKWLFPQAGTPQGGVVSPLLANIALHGLETALVNAVTRRQGKPGVIRYCDDFVILHKDLDTLLTLKKQAEAWLAEMGLRLNPDKTRISHTLHEHEGKVGFDFLGFTIRQYPAGKYRKGAYQGKPSFKMAIRPSKEAQQRHIKRLKTIVRQHRGSPQAALIARLNPVIRGWANYYRHCKSYRVLSRMDTILFHQLYRWARYRHRNKWGAWCYGRYWQRVRNRKRFTDGKSYLAAHEAAKITRHVKVRGDKSPYDGDWVYWAKHLGRDPTKPRRVTELMKRQKGRCDHCGLYFVTEDVIEVHHLDGDKTNNLYINLQLLHGHCHDHVHSNRC